MKIPILNIYYMLSYSWNCLDEAGIMKLSHSDYDSLKQLLSKVLSKGCQHLIKRGVDRSYLGSAKEYNGIKGKLNLTKSINKNLFSMGRSICEFDELDYNVIHNQIIKSTIYQLLRDKEIDSKTHSELKNSFQNLHQVEVIPLSLGLFRKVQLYRNLKSYDLLLRICKLIFENSTLNEQHGTLVFRDFQRDDKKMAKLFQSFIFNFFKKEQSLFKIKGEEIKWAFLPIGNSQSSFLPKMYTDITLENEYKKVIIDTKYYSKTLTTNRFGKETFHSDNLYQLFSYLLNQEKIDNKKSSMCTGILLYPKVDNNINEEFIYKEHNIIIRTVDLNRNWVEIKNELLSLICLG